MDLPEYGGSLDSSLEQLVNDAKNNVSDTNNVVFFITYILRKVGFWGLTPKYAALAR